VNRIFKMQVKMLQRIAEFENSIVNRAYPLNWERIHMISSAKIAEVLAMKRGVDPELAAVACSVHDYGRIVTGIQKGHAETGYIPIKAFLSELGFFDSNEIEIISTAAKNHSKKNEIGTPLEEVVKDADVLDCWQYNLPLEREEQKIRLENVIKELRGML
jgi:uncharacterized protein